MNAALIGALVLVLSACGTPVQDTTLVVSSDRGLVSEISRLLPALAERSQLSLREPVRAELRSRAELEAFLLRRIDEELPPEEAVALRDSYALLGLVPPDLDLTALLLSVYGEQVAGFYDPESEALYVMDDQTDATRATVLVHELVHAIQDQTAHLDSLTAKERGNDRQLAAQAAIEGHATLVMFEHLMSEQGIPLDMAAIPDFAGTIRPLLESMRAQFPALASAPRIFQESLLFPYLEGATFVQALWQAEADRPAPFGPALPTSTEQILDPARFLSSPRDEPTDVALTFDPGADPVYENTLGALETGILLGTHGGPSAESAREGWDGDRFALIRTDEGNALVWASVWDDAPARDRFLAALTPGLAGLGAPASLAPRTYGGRPGALLTVGAAPEPDVLLTGGT